MFKLGSRSLLALGRAPFMHSAHLKRCWSNVVEQVNRFQIRSLEPRRFKASTSTSAQPSHHEMHPPIAVTSEVILGTQLSPQKEQHEPLEVEKDMEDEAPLTAAELELFYDYIPPMGRIQRRGNGASSNSMKVHWKPLKGATESLC